jgi:hypothetical protein
MRACTSLPKGGKLGKRAQCDFHRFGAAPGEGNGEEIHQGTLGLMPHFRGNVVPPRRNNVPGKLFGHARFVQHHFPLIEIWPKHRRVAKKRNRAF